MNATDFRHVLQRSGLRYAVLCLVLHATLAHSSPAAEAMAVTPALAAVVLSKAPSAGKQVMNLLSDYLEQHKVCAGSPPQPFAPLLVRNLTLQSPPRGDAALRIASCRWDPLQKELQFYLQCSAPGTCRPFLATLPREGSPASGDAVVSTAHRVRTPPRQNATPPLRDTAALVRPGQSARLELTGPGIHIRLSVTCLERGNLGQQIRARVLGESRVLLATVTGPQSLAAELP